MTTNLHYLIAGMAVLLVVLWQYSHQRQMDDRNSLMFRRLLTVVSLDVLTELVSTCFILYAPYSFGVGRMLSNTVFYLFQAILPLMLLYYVCTLCSSRVISTGTVLRMGIPTIALVFILLTNPFTEKLFYFDSTGYCYGPWYLLLYISALLHIAAAAIFVAVHRDAVSRRNLTALLAVFLLAAFGIEKRLERLDEALIGDRAASIVERVLAGEVIAYCSDAGMPGVSDPGLRLVRAAREAGAPVEVLPGASACATAYVASGCTCPRFYFGGFFPRKDVERKAALDALRTLDAALIFYESPNRVASALESMAQVFPLREAAVCRELTKLHEEVVRAPLPDLRDEFARRAQEGSIKGEIAIVIDEPGAAEEDAAQLDAAEAARVRAAELKAEGARNKEIAKAIAAEFGLSRNAAYEIALDA